MTDALLNRMAERVMDSTDCTQGVAETVAREVLLMLREPDDRMLREAYIEMNRTPSGTWKRMKAENKTEREIFDAKMRPRFIAMIDAVVARRA